MKPLDKELLDDACIFSFEFRNRCHGSIPLALCRRALGRGQPNLVGPWQ